jgi:hypothetical protein
MKKLKGRMDESILVCVYYGPNGERLIQRGCKIANMLDCPLYILTIDPKPFDELDAEKSFYITRWKQLAEQHNAEEFISAKQPKVAGNKLRRGLLSIPCYAKFLLSIFILFQLLVPLKVRKVNLKKGSVPISLKKEINTA